MWERTLQDLIRGLRANKNDEAKFIAQAVEEIRGEVKGKDMQLKAGAVMKLTYLDMLGYDMSWASFYVVEVMSSHLFHLKSVGYLAAAQSFDQDTDVLMLTTNLLKKDLASSPAEVGVSLNGVSDFVTPDLARDLAPELIAMLNHSRAHIRKRAILALFKIILKYPKAARSSFARIQEKLDDPDPGVVAATVNVLCELARYDPKPYLLLAPQLFNLLTTSSNNWMLIKIVKLFGSLCPHEPRLVKKLQPPITELISTTPAISLLYECVHTCIIGNMLQGNNGDSLARLCISKLATFIQDSDQNLKYIALLAMTKIVPSHPYLVVEYQDTIMASLDDQDISIRMRALDLVSAMANPDSLQSIVQQLLSHLVPGNPSTWPSATQLLAQQSSAGEPSTSFSGQSPKYRVALAQRILAMCSKSTYENVTNFEWYISVLVDLTHIANVNVGGEIRDQLMDVVGRVKAVRRFTVKLMYTLLSDDTLLQNAGDEGSCAEVLWAAAWICGEYSCELAEPQKLIPYLLRPEMKNLAPDTIAVCINGVAKIFGHWAAGIAERWEEEQLQEIKELVGVIIEGLSGFTSSPFIEVQERAANILQLFTFIRADLASHRPKNQASEMLSDSADSFIQNTEPGFPKSLYLLQPLFTAFEMNPVAPSAQASVPIPEGLDLDAWIVPPPKEETLETVLGLGPDGSGTKKVKKVKKSKGKERTNGKLRKREELGDEDDEIPPSIPGEETAEETLERERRKAERLEMLRDDPYYLIDAEPLKGSVTGVEDIPVVTLGDMPPLRSTPGIQLLSQQRSPSPKTFIVEREGEMPEGILSLPQQTTSPFTIQDVGLPRSSAAELSRFTPYEAADDEIPRTSTPDPIRVSRPKKKGRPSSKKHGPE